MSTMDAPTAFDRVPDYVRHRSEHTTLINRLRALGAQADLDIPRIAVIGKQGAGKSSLIEAISGIPVPRGVGTCTRCPFECRMVNTPDTPWSCQVSIRCEFARDGSPVEDVDQISFGPRLTDKADVELMLRRAQAAILDPQSDSQELLKRFPEALNSPDANTLSYSRNVVCAELSGPELPDLTFIDLPGIVHNAPPETVQLVEDLVLSHIGGNCVILCAVPMSSTESSILVAPRAVQLAKQVDPCGSRTIGVLTKVDGIRASISKEIWVEVLEGRRFPLTLGYFCTRQPNESERAAQMSTRNARNAESAFFATATPWSSSTYQHHIGTQKLVAAISAHLSHAIDKSLPKLATEMTTLLTSCDAHLEMLPRPISPEPFVFISSLIQKFSGAVQAFINGRVDTATLIRENRASYANLKKKICSTAPLFVPHTHAVSLSSLPCGLLGIDYSADASSASVQITLAEVRHRIRSAVTRELPSNVPYAAKMLYVDDFQKEWSDIAQETAKSVHASLSQIVVFLVKEHFAQHQLLESHIRATVENLIRDRFNSTCTQISRLLEYERTAFTQNDYYLSSTKEKLLTYYREGRLMELEPATQAPPVSSQVGNNQASEMIKPDIEVVLKELSSSSSSCSAVPAPATVTGANAELTAFEGLNHSQLQQPNASWCFPDPVTLSSFIDVAVSDQETIAKMLKHKKRSGMATAERLREKRQSHSDSIELERERMEVQERERQAREREEQECKKQERERQEREEQERTERERAKRQQDQRLHDEALVLEFLARLGYKNLTMMDFETLKGPKPDEFDEELEVMAEVRAYFHVAYKRIIDYVPLAIDHELLYAFANELQTRLMSTLGLSSGDVVAKSATYLAEDPSVVAERDRLLARKEQLMNIQAQLRGAGVSS